MAEKKSEPKAAPTVQTAVDPNEVTRVQEEQRQTSGGYPADAPESRTEPADQQGTTDTSQVVEVRAEDHSNDPYWGYGGTYRIDSKGNRVRVHEESSHVDNLPPTS